MDVATSVWASSPQRAAMAVDRLMALRLVSAAAIARWVRYHSSTLHGSRQAGCNVTTSNPGRPTALQLALYDVESAGSVGSVLQGRALVPGLQDVPLRFRCSARPAWQHQTTRPAERWPGTSCMPQSIRLLHGHRHVVIHLRQLTSTTKQLFVEPAAHRRGPTADRTKPTMWQRSLAWSPSRSLQHGRPPTTRHVSSGRWTRRRRRTCLPASPSATWLKVRAPRHGCALSFVPSHLLIPMWVGLPCAA